MYFRSLCIGVTSYVELGHVPPTDWVTSPLLELALVHQFGNFFLRITTVGSAVVDC